MERALPANKDTKFRIKFLKKISQKNKKNVFFIKKKWKKRLIKVPAKQRHVWGFKPLEK